jgi:hypothetical protein
VTVIDTDARNIASAWLEITLNDFLLRDDVIEPAFFVNILLVRSKEFKPKTFNFKWGTSTVRVTQRTQSLPDVTGQYIIDNNTLWPVLRLYDDVRKTLFVTLQPTLNNK